MNRGKSLLPRMAAANIRKNGSTYFPYIGVSIFTMFTYFVFDLIVNNDLMSKLPRASYATVFVEIGFFLLSIIMVPFLYYTNSFLIKRRKKELGLYSILGMEKKHIGIMMFWESLVAYILVLAAAIPLGLLFARLLFLMLLNLAKLPVDAAFAISPRAIVDTLVFYALVSVLNLFVNLVQVGKARPVELMAGSRKGEKEPKSAGLTIWSFAGMLALGTGYYLAVRAEINSMLFADFFLAVLLVIVGTYFLFTSGSIALLKYMKKRKRYYYRPENFITVSGMLYRMKKNAAGLSNICIFATMFLITVICTVSLGLSIDSITAYSYPRTFELYFNGEQDEASLKAVMERAASENGVELEDYLGWSGIPDEEVYIEGNRFRAREAGDNIYDSNSVLLMTAEEFGAMEHSQVSLEAGEILIFSGGADLGYDTLVVGGSQWRIKEELAECSYGKRVKNDTSGRDFVIVFADSGERIQAAAGLGLGEEQKAFRMACNPRGEAGAIDAFRDDAAAALADTAGYVTYGDYRQEIAEVESMYGGLMFIGIFFGSIFLICLLIIMYYKQITEGFEDQNNFEIMQKVGMSDEEIRGTIQKQIRLVFALPLAGAILHTVVGMNMVVMLMAALHNYEVKLMVVCTTAVCTVFAVVYALCYKRTSTTYYKIVRHMN